MEKGAVFLMFLLCHFVMSDAGFRMLQYRGCGQRGFRQQP